MTILLATQLLNFLIFQITTLFDLYPLNNVHHDSRYEMLRESLLGGLSMAVQIFCTISGSKVLLAASTVLITLSLVGGFYLWWRPYFFGPDAWWSKIYDKKLKKFAPDKIKK